MSRTTPFPVFFLAGLLTAAAAESPFAADPGQAEERTSFQTAQPWNGHGNLRADVAMVYGIGPTLPERVKTWRDRGYRVHLMTGVAWGEYQDYLYGRFDGTDHTDNAQTDRHGNRISHGGDVYYMCPASNFGEFLAAGVQQALEAGVEAVHLEEPEFWARAGYSEGFKREWRAYYDEPWQPPHETPDAQWRASRLKYFLYSRALGQVFDHVAEHNRKTGSSVRCYVPTHSLLNYAHWCIVSPESGLAAVDGCDGVIAQVWTGTARTPNHFRGVRKERTFETAFLEYGAAWNLVRGSGRRVWFLNDPVEDNPHHDWNDYRSNWESTLTASLLHPEVWRFEVAPWPERVFNGKYPRNLPPAERRPIPPDYASELQVVMHALEDMKQSEVRWDAGVGGVGLLISDSLMFQREQPTPSDPNMAHIYGLALPLVHRAVPLAPVQLENIPRPGYLDPFRVLLLTYEGQKPLSPEVHDALAGWVREGGRLIIADDDRDPYNQVREWWNEGGKTDLIPRRHLFSKLGLEDAGFDSAPERSLPCGKGGVTWLKKSPVSFALSREGDREITRVVSRAVRAAGLEWKAPHRFILRRGPWIVAAGSDEPLRGVPTVLNGRFINLFDPALELTRSVAVTPGSRFLLLDLDKRGGGGAAEPLLASCKTLAAGENRWHVEGVANTPGIALFSCPQAPARVVLDGAEVSGIRHDAAEKLLWLRFANEARPRLLELEF